MDNKNKNECIDLLDHVEQGVNALVKLTTGLREENEVLMRQQKNTADTRAADTRATDEKIRNARVKIEALITQLKALEQ